MYKNCSIERVSQRRLRIGFALIIALFLAIFAAGINAQADVSESVTFSSYDISTYREASYGTPPNGEESTAGCHILLTAEFDGELTLSDADAASESFVLTDDVSVGTVSSIDVSVDGSTLTVDLTSTHLPGGIIEFEEAVIEGLTCDGYAVYWPGEFETVVPTGLSFHVTDVTVGTEDTPASTTIRVDSSSVIRSMNHILWTSNGDSIVEGTGTSQTTGAHHHAYYSLTICDSAQYIASNASSLEGYTVTYENDTVTITADTAVEGEYLGIYNYDDDFLQTYGFTLDDSVTGLDAPEAVTTLDIAKRCTVTVEDTVLWTGAAIEAAVTVTDKFNNGVSDYELVEGTDYTVSYADNVDVGTATVTITGIGDYTGTLTATFEITESESGGTNDTDDSDSGNSGSNDTDDSDSGNSGSNDTSGSDTDNSGSDDTSGSDTDNSGSDDTTGSDTDNSGTVDIPDEEEQGETNSPTVTKKKAQTIKVKNKSNKKTIKAKKLKNKKQTFKVKVSRKGKGKVTFTKKSGSKKLKISKKGKVTVKKGTAKGTYKMKVKVKVKATAKYKAKTKTIQVIVKVK